MSEPIIAEATGYAGGNHGPTLPLVQLAMAQAVSDCNALGIADDTPNVKLAEIVGRPLLAGMFGEEPTKALEGQEIVERPKCDTVVGADYIREIKLAARNDAADQHRGLVKAHESAKAAELHTARDA